EILGSAPDFYKRLNQELDCFVYATAGSSYGRLFPRKSIRFFHSSNSLHWLSQVPQLLANGRVVNKGQIYLTKSSSIPVVDAYLGQFKRDISLLLRSRAEELVTGGRAVFSFIGRASNTSPKDELGCKQWEFLARALMSMVDEDKVDSFNTPYYAPSRDEVMEEVEREESFLVEQMKAVDVEWDGQGRSIDDHVVVVVEETTPGKRHAKLFRAVIESMIKSHFGGGIINELFKRYAM
ncbi:Probable jasmonic acid carboxyl methyltransferase 1, partial [Linum grandiflorum]